MKKHLFGSTILPLALVVSLCACGSTPGGSAPSEGTQSAASQAQTDSAMSGGELSIGNDFYIESGAVLSDGSIYLVGKEGANGFCAYVSTDDGDSWSKEELSWADQDVVAITILPDGFMLGTQGQQVVYAPRGEDLKTADLSALGTVDGISAAYPISTDAFTVSGGKTETFVDKPLGKGPIQEIFAGTAHHKDYGEPVVITNNYVTFEARRYAKDLAVEIIAAPEWEEFRRINIEGRVDNPNQHTGLFGLMIAVLLKDKDYFDKVITSTEGEKIKNKNELKLQIISEFDEAEECVKEAAYLQQKAAQFQQRALNIQKRALLRNLTYD